MNYIESVNYIHSLLKFGIRPGLNGMDALLHLLGEPHKDLKYVHVAGTNGKGSTSTAISNVLIESGYNVGLYTSPYVTDFLERVQYNGKPVDRDIFANSVTKVKEFVEILEKQGTEITEFEALTASAFMCFKSLDCDVVVLEVGLGGRLDATNVIDTPLVNVITSLSIDHSAILGNTIEEIAFEKCGTIKENGTVVTDFAQDEAALKIIKNICSERNNRLIEADITQLRLIDSDIFGSKFIYKDCLYETSMAGFHQLKNMTCVIEVCEILRGFFKISDKDIFNGIKKTVLPARVEIISKKPLVILDGGHNADGAKAFYDSVIPQLLGCGRVYVVAGMMADKEVRVSLKPLIEYADCFIAVTPDNPRAMSCDELADITKNFCENMVAIPSPVEAVKYVSEILGENDVLLVVGSLYLAGEVRETLLELFNN